MIANGVEARVVRDVVSEDGVPTEVTDDWYAQDADGNIWYLGEATTEYVDGKPKTTAGSFEAGVDGAQAGIVMPAEPKPGLSYRQEYYKGEAEDEAVVISTNEQVEVALRPFPAGADDKGHQPAGAEGPRIQVLRPRRRARDHGRRLRRQQDRGAGQLHQGRVMEPAGFEPATFRMQTERSAN